MRMRNVVVQCSYGQKRPCLGEFPYGNGVTQVASAKAFHPLHWVFSRRKKKERRKDRRCTALPQLYYGSKDLGPNQGCFSAPQIKFHFLLWATGRARRHGPIQACSSWLLLTPSFQSSGLLPILCSPYIHSNIFTIFFSPRTGEQTYLPLCIHQPPFPIHMIYNVTVVSYPSNHFLWYFFLKFPLNFLLF